MKRFLAAWSTLVVLTIVTLVQATPQTQPLDMQGYKINRLGAGVANSDAVRVDQLPTPVPTATPITGTGVVVQTAANTYVTRTLQAPAAGFSITNPAGQAGDPTFVLANDLSALEALSTTGLVARTGSETYTPRTLQSASAGLTWTNGDGVAGNPVPVFANDLGALEALASTGLAARTASDTWAQRTITGPAAGISVANGSGAGGNPTLSLTNDLSAVEGLASNGMVARTATDTWTTRTLGAGTGLSWSNGDGVAGAPSVSPANDLGAIEALNTNAILARTGTDTWAARTITGPAAGITVSNGSGVSGNPTLALANDLSALEGMSSTGLVARTASETYAQRTITATTDVTSITNGDGVSGNPTIDLASSVKAGWMPSGETWTYASGSGGGVATFTVGSDVTGKYEVGDKIKLTQTSVKYFYVSAEPTFSSPNTTITIYAGTDYTLANAAITSPYYSKDVSPVDFPQTFTYTPSEVGFSSTTTLVGYFNVIGRRVFLNVRAAGTSDTTALTLGIPITAKTVSGQSWLGWGTGTDNGGTYQNNVLGTISSAGTTMSTNPQGGSVNWTNVNSKSCNIAINYDI